MLKLHTEGGGEQGGEIRLSLDELAREGARRLLQAALEAEVAAYLERHREEKDEAGHALVVRNGKARPRQLTLGAGTVEIQAPRVNDRRVIKGQRQRFTSELLPPYMRRSPKVAEVCCRCSTCGGSPRGTSGRRCRRCWARKPRRACPRA